MKRVLGTFLAAIIFLSAVPFVASASPVGNIIGISEGAQILDDSKVEDFGNIVLGEDLNILEIPILWDGFNTYGPASASDINADVMNKMELKFSPSSIKDLFTRIEKEPYSTYGDAKFILTAEDIGVADGYLSVLYDGVESGRIRINGRFIDPTINKSITGLTGLNLASYHVYQNDDKITEDDLSSLLIRPGDEIKFQLNTEFFDWDPDILDMRTAVRKSTLDNNHIGIIKKIAKGNQWIDKIEIENVEGWAHVIVKFKEDFVSVDEKDISLSVSLAYKKKEDPGSTVNLFGQIENPKEFLSEDVDYVNMADGLVVEADEFLRDVRLELGCDVYIYMNLQKGRSYYATATDERSDGDIAVMDYYPVIRRALTLKTVNISGSGRMVEIRTDEPYYAYDADGLLLGTTDERLPLRDKYYLAIQQIVFEKGTLPAPQSQSETYNENPETGGAGSMVNLAATGFLLLAAAGILSRSGRRG